MLLFGLAFQQFVLTTSFGGHSDYLLHALCVISGLFVSGLIVTYRILLENKRSGGLKVGITVGFALALCGTQGYIFWFLLDGEAPFLLDFLLGGIGYPFFSVIIGRYLFSDFIGFAVLNYCTHLGSEMRARPWSNSAALAIRGCWFAIGKICTGYIIAVNLFSVPTTERFWFNLCAVSSIELCATLFMHWLYFQTNIMENLIERFGSSALAGKIKSLSNALFTASSRLTSQSSGLGFQTTVTLPNLKFPRKITYSDSNSSPAAQNENAGPQMSQTYDESSANGQDNDEIAQLGVISAWLYDLASRPKIFSMALAAYFEEKAELLVIISVFSALTTLKLFDDTNNASATDLDLKETLARGAAIILIEICVVDVAKQLLLFKFCGKRLQIHFSSRSKIESCLNVTFIVLMLSVILKARYFRAHSGLPNKF